jgi:uncharacterized protein (TIGR03118 family)
MPVSISPLVVSIPGGAPTGAVFNPSTSFAVGVGNERLPARFLFDSEAGVITAWPLTDPPMTSARAELRVPGAIFKALALGFVHGRGHLLYAADFHHNQIVVVNGRFHRVHLEGGFRDRHLPHGFAPFNIQNIGGKLYVAYAKQDADAGRGRGRRARVRRHIRTGHRLGRLRRPNGHAVQVDGLWACGSETA